MDQTRDLEVEGGDDLMTCGSCFCDLPHGVGPLAEDQAAHLGPEVFYIHPSRPLHFAKGGVESLRRSATRGCPTCKAIHDYLLSHISTQDCIHWQGLLGDGIRVYRGASSPGDEDTSATKIRNDGSRPPTVSFDLFCTIDTFEESIPQFMNQNTRPIHPFLTIGCHPSGNTKSELALSRFNRWLSTCVATHNLCGKVDCHNPPLPNRVLWLESEDRIRVVENQSATTPYIALSHRWGKSTEEVSLRTTNMSEYKEGILAQSLPQLFRDVFYLCRRLGIQYLWIDSLCIVQDDLNDWETVAATMGAIYENAFLTISADWVGNSDQSLFAELQPSHRTVQLPDIGDRQMFMRRQYPHPTPYPRDDPGHEGSGELPLLNRGWVFQERALSKRIIHFTQYELCWECVERTCCECRLNEGHWDELRSKVPRIVVNTNWDTIVQEYSLLGLSFDKDKLQALAGVSRRFALHHGLQYAAGLWVETLERSFLWRRLKHSPASPRPEPRVAPSWSWASINGPIWMNHFDKCRDIKFLGHEVEPLGIDPYGSVKSAHLLVSGFLVGGKIYHGQEWRTLLEARPRVTAHADPLWDALARSNLLRESFMGILLQDGTYSWLPDYSVDVAGPSYIPSGSEVYCLLCCDGGVVGLVLRRHKSGIDCYERIGILDNDPFVKVPTESLLPLATQEDIILV